MDLAQSGFDELDLDLIETSVKKRPSVDPLETLLRGDCSERFDRNSCPRAAAEFVQSGLSFNIIQICPANATHPHPHMPQKWFGIEQHYPSVQIRRWCCDFFGIKIPSFFENLLEG